MRLKAAILAALRRDGLKKTVDMLGIGGVDRRSAEQMRNASLVAGGSERTCLSMPFPSPISSQSARRWGFHLVEIGAI